MPIRLLSLLLLAVPQSFSTAADDSWERRVTPEERTLVTLIRAFKEEHKAYYAQAAKIDDPQEELQFYEQHDPALESVPKLLDYERQMRGSDSGLMALRQLVLLAGSGGPVNNPRDEGRRQALRRLSQYADRPLFLNVLYFLERGNFEPKTVAFLRSLAQSETATPEVVANSQLYLARYMLASRDAKAFQEKRLQELNEGAEVRYFAEKMHRQNVHNLFPDDSEMKRWENEAISILRHLAISEAEYHLLNVESIDPEGVLLRVAEDQTGETQTLSSLAENLLFKESRLRIEKPAPDLNIKLISGKDWSLSAQSGRVTIIQFSFRGCGPCEAMYPDLREMQKEHGDRLAVLSIMNDERKEDAEEVFSSGKITWSVHWDGARGPLNTRWGIDSFPTVYVVDPHRRIAAKDIRGEELKAKVAELLK